MKSKINLRSDGFSKNTTRLTKEFSTRQLMINKRKEYENEINSINSRLKNILIKELETLNKESPIIGTIIIKDKVIDIKLRIVKSGYNFFICNTIPFDTRKGSLINIIQDKIIKMKTCFKDEIHVSKSEPDIDVIYETRTKYF